MKSKLDYLSKYQENPKRKSKKKKKKKKADDRDVEDDDDADLLPPPPDDDDEETNISDADAPVVVSTTVDAALNKPKGKWELVGPSRNDDSRKQRHDSSSSENESSTGGRRRKRHDSDSEDEPPRRRTRHDSDSDDSASHSRQRRHDSSSGSDSSASGPRKRQRHDSSSSSSSDDGSAAPGRTKRRHDSSSDEDETTERMASGHRAGLQSGGDFAQKERNIQTKRHQEAKEMVEKYGVGETVYRSKQADTKNGDKRKPLTAEEHKRLHTGRAQLEQEEQAKREFAAIQQSQFARRADDAALEEERKREIRADDPMAAFATRRSALSGGDGATAQRRNRPVYKGPAAKPNRFGIRPGHRWDAHDRGNGFEDRLLAKRSSARHEQERSYRYSAADM